MFFWNSLAFSMIQHMLAIWSLVPLPFLNPVGHLDVLGSHTSLENFEHYFASLWGECNCMVLWMFFFIALLWDWNENWPFPVLRRLLIFPNLLAYWVQWIVIASVILVYFLVKMKLETVRYSTPRHTINQT